jgi:hypothetical protein
MEFGALDPCRPAVGPAERLGLERIAESLLSNEENPECVNAGSIRFWHEVHMLLRLLTVDKVARCRALAALPDYAIHRHIGILDKGTCSLILDLLPKQSNH